MNLKRTFMNDARMSKKITQGELAIEVGTTRGHIAHIENGTRDPSVVLAKELASVLGLDWTIFFETKCVVSKQSGSKLQLNRKKKEKIKRRPYTQKEREYICKFADYDDLKSIAEALDRTPKAIKDQISLLKKSELFEQYKKRYDERQARTVG